MGVWVLPGPGDPKSGPMAAHPDLSICGFQHLLKCAMLWPPLGGSGHVLNNIPALMKTVPLHSQKKQLRGPQLLKAAEHVGRGRVCDPKRSGSCQIEAAEPGSSSQEVRTASTLQVAVIRTALCEGVAMARNHTLQMSQ